MEGHSKTLAIVIVALLALLVAAYSFLQVGGLNDKLSKQGDVASRLSGVEASVAELQKALLPPAVTLTLYFDSSEKFTQDVLPNSLKLGPLLQRQGLAIVLSDQKGNLANLSSRGFKSLPALFVSTGDVVANPTLQQALAGQPIVKDGYAIDGLGFVSKSKVMLSSECKSPGKAVVYEFADYQCLGCNVLQAEVRQFVQKYSGKVDFQFRQLPVAARPETRRAAEAALCAKAQGKLDEYGDKLFANQANMTEKDLVEYARQLSLNTDAFNACLNSPENANKVQADVTEALLTYHILSPPAFVVDCKYVFSAVGQGEIEQRVCEARPDVCANAPVVQPAATQPTAPANASVSNNS